MTIGKRTILKLAIRLLISLSLCTSTLFAQVAVRGPLEGVWKVTEIVITGAGIDQDAAAVDFQQRRKSPFTDSVRSAGADEHRREDRNFHVRGLGASAALREGNCRKENRER